MNIGNRCRWNLNPVVTRHHFRCILEDMIIPFFVGFFCVYAFFWVQGALFSSNDIVDDKVPLPTPAIPSTLQEKNGQLYVQKHGIKGKEADTFRNQADRLEFSIQVDASKKFKTEYIRHVSSENRNTSELDFEPPGTIWPWPRIEKEAPSTPLVWVVTPTFRSPYQYAELTRVAQSMYPARKFVRWLVVDDTRWQNISKFKIHTTKLKTFLNQFKVNYTLLKSDPRPPLQRVVYRPKGVEARNTALKYIRMHNLDGVVYFADDDNTYDSDIFRQMQATTTVSVWPTGAITEWTISSPIVNKQGAVIDFFDAFAVNRDFPVDFASFAVHTNLIHNNPEVNIPYIHGYEETYFLKNLNVDKSKFLPLAANATQVLTWHTITVKFNQKVEITRLKFPFTVQKLLGKYDFLYQSTPATVSRMKTLETTATSKPRKRKYKISQTKHPDSHIKPSY